MAQYASKPGQCSIGCAQCHPFSTQRGLFQPKRLSDFRDQVLPQAAFDFRNYEPRHFVCQASTQQYDFWIKEVHDTRESNSDYPQPGPKHFINSLVSVGDGTFYDAPG